MNTRNMMYGVSLRREYKNNGGGGRKEKKRVKGIF